jgi:hypothetical protein
LILALALLAGLTLSTAAQAGPAKKVSAPGKNCSKKKDTGKKCHGTKKGPGTSDPAPECGDGTWECHLDIWVRQGSPTTGATCAPFTNREGFCVGSSTGTASWSQPGYFPRQGFETNFTWKGPGGPRDVDLTINSTFTIIDSYIRGDVPGPGSSTFNVTDAWSRASGIHWKSRSNGGGPPGLPGGPLYIDYGYKTLGSYVHIYGYLVPK